MAIYQIVILVLIGCMATVCINAVVVNRKYKKAEDRLRQKHKSDMEWVEKYRRHPK